MPDMWTHLIAGDQIAKAVDIPEWVTVINEHRSIFNFGCQGPDFLLYYNFWPWSKDKRGHDLGETIHHERCGDFINEVFGHISTLSGHRQFYPAVAYGFGLLCHWALDRATHPYIHYISGLHEPDDPAVSDLAGNHKRIEAIIDTLLVEPYWGVKTNQTPANQRFDLGKELPSFIVDLYHHVIPTIYPDLWRQQAQGFIEKSYRDMMTACRVLFDPTGIKIKALGWFQRISGNQQNLTSYFYPRHVNAAVDYLNDQHLPWCHPGDRNEVSQASFGELMDNAVADGIEMVNTTIAYLRGEISNDTWRKSIGNLSFSTGKDCDLPMVLKYTQPILD